MNTTININKDYKIIILRNKSNTFYVLKKYDKNLNDYTKKVESFNEYSFLEHCKSYIRITKTLKEIILLNEEELKDEKK